MSVSNDAGCYWVGLQRSAPQATGAHPVEIAREVAGCNVDDKARGPPALTADSRSRPPSNPEPAAVDLQQVSIDERQQMCEADDEANSGAELNYTS